MESPGHLPIQWFHGAFKVLHYPFWSGLPVNTEGKTPLLRSLLEAAWCEPLIVWRWQRVALRMDAASCETVAAALPATWSSVVTGSAPLRYLSLERATEGWALETGGRVTGETAAGWCPDNDASASTPTTRDAGQSAAHRHPSIRADSSLAI